MNVVGISMIRNDVDIVEPFVRHTLRLLDHLFVIDHGNHAVIRIGPAANQLPLPALPQLALAHYPVRSAPQLTNKTVMGYLAHLAASRPGVEEQRVATHWRRCYEDMVIQEATRHMSEQQLFGWFYGLLVPFQLFLTKRRGRRMRSMDRRASRLVARRNKLERH